MKTLTLTEEQFKHLHQFLGEMLSQDSWLGSKLLHQEGITRRRLNLVDVLHKCEWAKRGKVVE